MKQYVYVGTEYTMVRLTEKGAKVPVEAGGIVESDIDLTKKSKWFRLVEDESTADKENIVDTNTKVNVGKEEDSLIVTAQKAYFKKFGKEVGNKYKNNLAWINQQLK